MSLFGFKTKIFLRKYILATSFQLRTQKGIPRQRKKCFFFPSYFFVWTKPGKTSLSSHTSHCQIKHLKLILFVALPSSFLSSSLLNLIVAATSDWHQSRHPAAAPALWGVFKIRSLTESLRGPEGALVTVRSVVWLPGANSCFMFPHLLAVSNDRQSDKKWRQSVENLIIGLEFGDPLIIAL